MNSEESNPVQSPEADLGLEALEAVEGPRRKRRWWRWLLLCCLLGVAAYGLLLYRGQTEQLDAWLTHLTQVAYAAYERLPGIGQNPAQNSKPTATPAAGGKPAEAPAARAVPVVATAVRQGNMDIYLNGLGSVTAFNMVTVRTRVDGQLIKVAFQEGQLVHQGDLLAEIDPRPFQVQLAQAEGQLAKDEAMLKNARIDLERYRVLLAQDSVAKQQLDSQTATVNQFEGVIRSDQAQIDNAKLQLTYSRITAPITGRIGLRLVDPGNVVRANDPNNGLAVITQLQPIAVVFNVPEDDLPQVLKKMRTGQKLVVEAYDRNLKNKLAPGTLLTIDNQIDPNTGTVKCKAVFPNEDNALFPNQFVNARLLVDTKKDASIVPSAAVQRSPQGTFVYVVKDDTTVEMRNVVVGPSEGDTVAIDKGLAPGEVVVIEGVDKLQRGMKVAARMVGDSNAKGNQ
jgi:multidrug efflux system membrane fusion protein